MKSATLFVISAMLYLMPSAVNAQLISVQSQLSSDSMMIGDQVVYNLRVDAADAVEFLLPAIQDTLSGNLEVLFRISSDTVMQEGRRVVNHSYMITGFEAGMQLVPAQEVLYSAGELVDTALSMPLIIQVFDPVIDTSQQIKPIKPPINTPLTFKEVLPWTGIGLGALLAVILVIYLIRRYGKGADGQVGMAQEPLEPAHIIAFRELDRLKAGKVWEKGEVKRYYSSLTNITRHYIERQYGIPAMERTTEEIMRAFRNSNLDDSLLDDMLRDLLELADLVKFAKEDPLPVDNQTNLNNAYIFIQKTYPLFYNEQMKEEAGNG